MNKSMPKKQLGLTLVELMVALVLGLLLSAGVVQLLVNTNSAYRVQENMGRIQEAGRFALDFLSFDMRMAGYRGCGGADVNITNTVDSNPPSFLYDYNTYIEGFAGGASAWSPSLPSVVSALNPIQGTDVLVLRTTIDDGAVVVQHPGGNPPGSSALMVSQPNSLAIDDVVMVSDCVDAAVFQITNFNLNAAGTQNQAVHNTGGTATPGNWTNDLGKEYTGGEMIKLATYVYFIGVGANGRPSLFRKQGANAALELVEGVENLKVLYGVDTNNDAEADQYQTADVVAVASNWQSVVSAQVSLLVQSADNFLVSDAQQYVYDGAATTAADRRIRQVFTATVGLRNRLP